MPKNQYLLPAYSLTSKPILEALITAHRRGVLMHVIADKKSNIHNKYSIIKPLSIAGIAVRLNGKYSIFHHKFMVIDDHSVETGSFNYSSSAENRNAENLIYLINTPEIAKIYTEEWVLLWNEAEELK